MLKLKDGFSAQLQILLDASASLRVIAQKSCESEEEFHKLHNEYMNSIMNHLDNNFGEEGDPV